MPPCPISCRSALRATTTLRRTEGAGVLHPADKRRQEIGLRGCHRGRTASDIFEKDATFHQKTSAGVSCRWIDREGRDGEFGMDRKSPRPISVLQPEVLDLPALVGRVGNPCSFRIDSRMSSADAVRRNGVGRQDDAAERVQIPGVVGRTALVLHGRSVDYCQPVGRSATVPDLRRGHSSGLQLLSWYLFGL